MKITVVIPVYNEIDTIRELYLAVASVPLDKEIILVDDYSTDGTREVLSGLADETTKVLMHAVIWAKALP